MPQLLRPLLACAGLAACTGAEAPPVAPPPTRPTRIVGLLVLPDGVGLAPGQQQTFSAYGLDTSGRSVELPVHWSAAGGSLAPDGPRGVYTAGVTPGSYQITATSDLAGVAGAATLTITGSAPPLPSLPWLLEDFSTYGNTSALLDDALGIYSEGEDVNTGQIALDLTTGYGTSTRSMRYTIPDRSGDSGRCHDYTVGRNISLPRAVKELWVEVYVKFSSNFRTRAPSAWACASAAEYKFIFGRTTGGSRFDLNVGTFGDEWTFGTPSDPLGAGGTPPKTVPGADAVFDGQWHEYRLYFKVSSASGVADGAARFYLDGRLIKSFANVVINNPDIYGLALGRNMNQGPAEPVHVWWGRIRAWQQNPGW